MNYEVRENIAFQLCGLSGAVTDQNFPSKLLELSSAMWICIKRNNVANKGKNIWVYYPENKVYAGVQLEIGQICPLELLETTICFSKYAYYKHIGHYNSISQTGIAIQNDLKSKGYCMKRDLNEPHYIEVYGDNVEDMSTFETELYFGLD